MRGGGLPTNTAGPGGSYDAISVYLIVRRYWGDRPKEPMEKLFTQLAHRAEQLCSDYIIPKVLRPISSAIASRS